MLDQSVGSIVVPTWNLYAYPHDQGLARPPLPPAEAAGAGQRGLTLRDASQAHELAEGLLGPHEYTLSGQQVLHLVAASPCSAYDCESVALAEELQVVFVTCDRQVLRSFPQIAVSPKDFVHGTSEGKR